MGLGLTDLPLMQWNRDGSFQLSRFQSTAYTAWLQSHPLKVSSLPLKIDIYKKVKHQAANIKEPGHETLDHTFYHSLLLYCNFDNLQILCNFLIIFIPPITGQNITLPFCNTYPSYTGTAVVCVAPLSNTKPVDRLFAKLCWIGQGITIFISVLYCLIFVL